MGPELDLVRHSKLYAFASVLSQKRRRAAPANLGYLRTNQEYIMWANFDFLGKNVKVPGQVKVVNMGRALGRPRGYVGQCADWQIGIT